MRRTVSFWKMHGAGNDFVLICDDDASFPQSDAAGMARLCAAHTGIGADGLILLQPSDCADFRMVFFNPDGTPASMCGNGARCAARLAADLGRAPMHMHIETAAGIHRAERLAGDLVRLELPEPRQAPTAFCVNWEGADYDGWSLNTGVPHAVIPVRSLAALDVARFGAFVRHHEWFAPAGTNVDFMERPAEEGAPIAVRTYERGVEAETLACGTGVVATALVALALEWRRSPVEVRTVGGDLLRVEEKPLRLTGPARYVFRGEVALDDFFSGDGGEATDGSAGG